MEYKIVTRIADENTIVIRIEETITGYCYIGYYAIFDKTEIGAKDVGCRAVCDMIADMKKYKSIFTIFVATLKGKDLVWLMDAVVKDVVEEFKIRKEICK